MTLDAMDLTDVVDGQVSRLGPRSRTNKAVQIFGHIGLAKDGAGSSSTSPSIVDATAIPSLPHKRRLRVRPRTLLGLLFNATRKMLIRYTTRVGLALLDICTIMLKNLLQVCSAHTLLMAALLVSLALNAWSARRDTLQWWRDRTAVGFMRRIGVRPNQAMARAVWLRDIEDWAGNASMVAIEPESSAEGERICADTFEQLLVETDPMSAVAEVGSSSSRSGAKQTSRRLQRTRSALGGYRHDLLVALRVVNRIEKEVVEAEWESWVRDEVGRCGQLEAMLNEKGNATLTEAKDENKDEKDRLQVVLGGLSGGQERGIEKWYQQYCGSCRIEWEGLKRTSGDAGMALL